MKSQACRFDAITPLLAIVFFTVLIAPAFSQNTTENTPPVSDQISAKAEISKSSATIGEPLTLKVKAIYSKGAEILNGINEPEAAGLELKNSQDWHDRDGKKEVLGRSFSVVGYQLGKFMIEPVEISYREKGGPIRTISTNPVYLAIESVDQGKEKTDIRDVKGVVRMPYAFMKYAVPTGVILLLLALLLVYLLYFRKRELERLKAAARLSPAQEALQNLRELFDSTLIRDGRIKAYYLRFSEILKIFLEKQFGIPAGEATTSEINLLLKRVTAREEDKVRLIEILTTADFAKFAKWIPAPADVLNLSKQAEEVVITLSAPHETAENQNAVS